MGDTHLKIECRSLKGKKRSANQDFIATFSLAEGVLIVLVDIATATSVDGNSFISTLNRKISQHITRAYFNETTLVPCFVKIVDELKKDFKTGCASLIVTCIPFRKSNVWGFVVGDARLGKLDQQKIEWITPVHTAANPFGEKFTEKMKNVPERHLLTRSLNMRKLFKPEYFEIDTSDGKSLIIASDGFWAELSTAQQHKFLHNLSYTTDDDSSVVKITNLHNFECVEYVQHSENCSYFDLTARE
jgi:serine/threonine protein phosphatase PrpC